MKIIFVRHGHQENDILTHLGKRQAKEIVKDLDYENISKIYSSPFGRAKQTAGIIAKKLKIKNVIIDKRIAEREKKTENMTLKEIEEYDENYLNSKYSHKNPEGCKDYLARVFSFLNEITKTNDENSTILIVGHSSMSYALAAYFHGIPKDGKLIWIRIGNCNKICYEYLESGK